MFCRLTAENDPNPHLSHFNFHHDYIKGHNIASAQYNPFAPLRLEDPPGLLSHYKLRRLTPAECAGLLEEANRRKLISSQPVADSGGACPLQNVVRVRDFGTVKLSSSFLASCPLALSSALYLQQQAKPLTRRMLGQELRQIDHFGSYACRNIYHRQNARRSEHATAEALDVSGFRLSDGRRVSVLKGWPDAQYHPWLQALLAGGCRYYGNALGPDYNAAHANHFHFGMRGQGFCF
ncbi:MAG: extensin family protein [Klebsiella oxytoca]|nr:extensin family protein [Klebsiella oxytoca]